MDTDSFFRNYYKKLHQVETKIPNIPITNTFDRILIAFVVIYIIAYAVLLFLNSIIYAAVSAVTALIIVLYLTRKMSTGDAEKIISNNQKTFQQRKFQTIKDLLIDYRINNDKSIDELLGCLEANKEKYKYGKVVGTAIKTGLGIISFVLTSALSTLLVKEIIEKTEKNIMPDEKTIEAIANLILEYWPLIIFDIVMTVFLIIELCFVWHAIIKPFIWKKYYYHETMILDLKAYKLFYRFHEEMSINLNIPISDGGKPKKLWGKIKDFFTKERHFKKIKTDFDS